MSNNIRVPSFLSKPDESRAVLDKYTGQVQTVINDLKDSSSLLQEAKNSIIPNSIFSSDLSQEVLKGKADLEKALKIDPTVVEKSIFANTSSALSSFTSLPTEYKSKLTNIGDAFSGQVNEVTQNVTGKIDTVNKATLPVMNSLSNIVSDVFGVSCNPSYSNKTAMIVFTSNILALCASLGMVQVLKCILNSPVLNDTDILSSVIKNITPKIALTGDIDLLNHISDSTYAKQAITVYPDFVSKFVSKYKLPKKAKPQDYVGIFESIKASFDKMQPGWDEYLRNDSAVFNASYIKYRSADFNKLLKTVATSTSLNHDYLESTLDTSTSFSDLHLLSVVSDLFYDKSSTARRLMSIYPYVYFPSVK